MITEAQKATLWIIIFNGGEMNAYAGQPGFHTRSVKPLERAGLVEPVPACDSCAGAGSVFAAGYTGCTRPLENQRGGGRCWNRIRITADGSNAVDPGHPQTPTAERPAQAAQ